MAEILHQLICSFSHYLQDFIHPRWCRISSINTIFFPQIALAIGVLTSNKGGGRRTTLFGGLDVAPGCHCRVQWTWCHCWVPLLGAVARCGGNGQLWGSGRGAIAGCHCWVLLQGVGGGEGDGQLCGSGRGAIAGCHCSALWWGGGWRPTLREWTWCHCRVPL